MIEFEAVEVELRDLPGTEDDGPLDSFSLFRRDIPRGPLLTADQEKALSRRLHGLDVLVPPPGNPKPTPEEALNRMIEQNLALVISVAKRFIGSGLPLEDLVQEGSLGLRRAGEKFNPDKGFKFSTYATWWIKNAVSLAIAYDTRTIHVPIKQQDEAKRFYKAKSELSSIYGRELTPEEIESELGVTPEEARQFEINNEGIASLSAVVSEFGDTLDVFLADPNGNPEDEYLNKERAGAVRRFLDELPLRQRTVLSLRYGIGEEQRSKPEEIVPGRRRQLPTLDEIGKVIGITREAARQNEEKAIAKARESRILRAVYQ